MIKNISLDIETFGLFPGDAVRSIGAVVFEDRVEGFVDIDESFYEPCADLYGRYNLAIDPDTSDWWERQSQAAKDALLCPFDYSETLPRFTAWLGKQGEYKLWTHGPAFDPPILAQTYRAVGLPIPWGHRTHRDTRTRFDDAGIYNHGEWMTRHGYGSAHHALHDAITQARAIQAASGDK